MIMKKLLLICLFVLSDFFKEIVGLKLSDCKGDYVDFEFKVVLKVILLKSRWVCEVLCRDNLMEMIWVFF